MGRSNFILVFLFLSLLSSASHSRGIELQGIAVGETLDNIKKAHELKCQTESYNPVGAPNISQSLCDLIKPIKIGQFSAPNVRLVFINNTLEAIHVSLSWDPPRSNEQFSAQQNHLLTLKAALEIKYPQATVRAKKPWRCNYCKHDDGYDFILPDGTINLSSGRPYKKDGFLLISYSSKSYADSSDKFSRASAAARYLEQQEAQKKRDTDQRLKASSLGNQL